MAGASRVWADDNESRLASRPDRQWAKTGVFQPTEPKPPKKRVIKALKRPHGFPTRFRP